LFQFRFELSFPFGAQHDQPVVFILRLVKLLLQPVVVAGQLFRQQFDLPSRIVQLLLLLLKLGFLHCNLLFEKV
jgi:hypothetical protein